MEDNMNFREKIISLLRKKGSMYLGDIAREMSVSPQHGYKFVEALMDEGLVMQVPGTLKISLC
jgi:Mn-dependent DtxR family transcriptional regulator